MIYLDLCTLWHTVANLDSKNGMEEVRGSIPLSSTKNPQVHARGFFTFSVSELASGLRGGLRQSGPGNRLHAVVGSQALDAGRLEFAVLPGPVGVRCAMSEPCGAQFASSGRVWSAGGVWHVVCALPPSSRTTCLARPPT